MLSSDEFDRRFDSGEDIEEFVDWSQKPVVIEPSQKSSASVLSLESAKMEAMSV
jgi:hypothetical protein